MTLHPLAKMRFAAPPERTPAGGYAGLVAVSVPADGVYRISAGSRLWIDLVELSGSEQPAVSILVTADR